MSHFRLTGFAGVAVLLGALMPLSAVVPLGAARAAGVPRSAASSSRAEAAQRALVAVEAAFGDASAATTRARGTAASADASLALRDLRVHLADLPPDARRTAQAYLARPTDSSEFYGASYSATAKPTSDCAEAPEVKAVADSAFCIHYATATSDRPPRTDANGNGVPDQVDRTRTVLDRVYAELVSAGGYDAPPSDGRSGGRLDGASRFDVYLADLGPSGLYGYCAPESPATTTDSDRAATSYCVLDNDFATTQFPAGDPLSNLRVTGAHEFFHAVQYGYDYREDSFFMENTASWVEDYVYPGIDDNQQFLVSSSLRYPMEPLDYYRFRYGNWIWWRYLTERFPQADPGSDLPVLVRQVWERATTTYSVDALRQTLAADGTSVAAQLSGFAVANRRPAAFYRDGAAYPTAPLGRTWKLRRDHRRTAWQDLTLAQLSNDTVAFRPAKSYGPGWWLRIRIDAPGARRSPYAEVTIVPRAGSPTSQVVPLAADGTGVVTTAFDAGSVASVELTLTNGGTRYACAQGTTWACEGIPRDAGRHFKFRAVSFPR